MNASFNFTNILRQLLCTQVPKAHKRQFSPAAFYASCVKSTRKHVDEIDPKLPFHTSSNRIVKVNKRFFAARPEITVNFHKLTITTVCVTDLDVHNKTYRYEIF